MILKNVKTIDLYAFVKTCQTIDRIVRKIEKNAFENKKQSKIATLFFVDTNANKIQTIFSIVETTKKFGISFKFAISFVRFSNLDSVKKQQMKKNKCFNYDLFGHLSKKCFTKNRVSEMQITENSENEEPLS